MGSSTLFETISASGISLAGAWNGATAYGIGQAVTYGGGLWLATAVNTNSAPSLRPPAIASDGFSRAPVSNGWGTADTGGLWTPGSSAVSVPAADFATQNGPNAGKITVDSTAPWIQLAGVSQQDTEILAAITPSSQAAATTDQGVMLRALTIGNTTWFYQASCYSVNNGTYQADVKVKSAGGTVTNTIISNGGADFALSFAGPNKVWIRFQVAGTNPTALRAKYWQDGTAEPIAWTLLVTNSQSQLQAAGAVGVIGYVSTGTATTLYQAISASAMPEEFAPTSPWSYLGPSAISLGVWNLTTSQSTIAHGRPWTPRRAWGIPQGLNGVGYSSAYPDATNVYLTASVAGTYEIMVS
jgi:hypothetical protein